MLGHDDEIRRGHRRVLSGYERGYKPRRAAREDEDGLRCLAAQPDKGVSSRSPREVMAQLLTRMISAPEGSEHSLPPRAVQASRTDSVSYWLTLQPKVSQKKCQECMEKRPASDCKKIPGASAGGSRDMKAGKGEAVILCRRWRQPRRRPR